MEINSVLTIFTTLLVLINSAQVIIAAWRKLKPEVKKLDAEAEAEQAETQNRILAGAKISNEILVNRINEFKTMLEDERAARKRDLEIERAARTAELDAEKAARKKETDYLRQKFNEADREARDYRRWAARLVRQVVEAGREPVAFIPTPPDDSQTGIRAITREDMEGDK